MLQQNKHVIKRRRLFHRCPRTRERNDDRHDRKHDGARHTGASSLIVNASLIERDNRSPYPLGGKNRRGKEEQAIPNDTTAKLFSATSFSQKQRLYLLDDSRLMVPFKVLGNLTLSNDYYLTRGKVSRNILADVSGETGLISMQQPSSNPPLLMILGKMSQRGRIKPLYSLISGSNSVGAFFKTTL